MPPKPANVVAAKVAREANATSRYLRRILDARVSGALNEERRRSSFQGSVSGFLRIAGGTGRVPILWPAHGALWTATGVRPKVQIRSEAVAKQLVLGGGRYVSWLPIRRTMDRADVYLASGFPFSRLDDDEQGTFIEMAHIRNAIAHSGAHASDKFRTKVILALGQFRSEKRAPARYLAGVHAGSATRMDELIGRASSAFRNLCK